MMRLLCDSSVRLCVLTFERHRLSTPQHQLLRQSLLIVLWYDVLCDPRPHVSLDQLAHSP